MDNTRHIMIGIVGLIVGSSIAYTVYTFHGAYISKSQTIESSSVETVQDTIGQDETITVSVINASSDDNLEFEAEIDLTDAGYDVVSTTRSTEDIPTSQIHYAESYTSEAETLAQWIGDEYGDLTLIPFSPNTKDVDIVILIEDEKK